VGHQIGTVALGGGLSSTQNVGRAVHIGWEAATEFDVVGWLDAMRGTKHTQTFGNLAFYANTMVLNARFESGPNYGRRPQYAPRYLTRAGINYRCRQNVKISFGATFVGDHFADDAQTPNRYIPAYGVADLTAEVTFWERRASLFGGINNLFDEDYYARIRADGIDPAARRNFYAGFKIRF
jgi:Fe(3+) dicitrate transport protein